MPWLTISIGRDALNRVLGSLSWMRPDAALVADTHSLPFPDGLKAINMQSAWASDGETAVNCGGFTDNAIVSRHWQLHAMGIRAPNILPSVAVTAGPGITANVICYERFYDILTDERSPLGAPSGTLVAANQTITYSNLANLNPPPRVTHIEGWESRDGGLPRFVWRRQVGVTTVVHATALGDLGEAETSTWTKLPRSRYGVFWHGRFCAAGNDADPTSIFFCEVGFPERWAGLSLSTKTKQPIVGIAEINGRLLVFTPFATEVVSGWTEDDLRIDILWPGIGLLSHHALLHTDGYLWVPSQEQPYLTDGSSPFPMGEDIKTKWASDFRANRKTWQKMWADHHPDEHIVRFYVGTATSDVSVDPLPKYTFWVADYETTLPSQGGGLQQPRWAYDVYTKPRNCAALCAIPGGRRREPLIGGGATDIGNGGTIYRDGDPLGQTDGEDFDGDNVLDMVTGSMQFDSLGGDVAHAMRMEELSVILRSEFTDWILRIYSGDVECYVPPDALSGTDSGGTPAYNKTVAFTREEVITPDGTIVKQPEWTHHFGGLPRVVGRAFVIRITCNNPNDLRFAGLVPAWKLGTTNRQPRGIQSEV